jgi:hypothetical protein
VLLVALLLVAPPLAASRAIPVLLGGLWIWLGVVFQGLYATESTRCWESATPFCSSRSDCCCSPSAPPGNSPSSTAGQVLVGIAAQPVMHTLPRHPDLLGYLGHRITSQHRQNGLIPSLHDRHSHQVPIPASDRVLPANNT